MISVIGLIIFIWGCVTDIFLCNPWEETNKAIYYLGIGLFVAGILI